MGYNFFKPVSVKTSLRDKLNQFLDRLGPAVSRGEQITFADNDLKYTLRLQNERIREKGIVSDYEYYSREDRPEEVHVAGTWNDAHYESSLCFKECGVRRTFSREGRKLYSDKRRSVVYMTLTDVLTGSRPDDESYCCPGCGAVTTVSSLADGCPYCGSRYKIDDLFPKVTGCYFLDDVGLTEKESKKEMKMFIGGTVAFCMLIMIISSLRDLGSAKLAANLLSLLIMVPLSAFMGYFFYSIYLLVKTIFIGVRQSHGKWGTIGSRSAFEKKMRAVYPEFSFEYFTGKAVSLIKTAVFSQDAQDLMFYTGGPLDPAFKDIIDLNYGGALGVTDFAEKDGLTVIGTNAFFDILYAKDDKVFLKRSSFRAVFCRRTDIPIDYGFSMTRLQCPTCGSSFDAIANRKCPFCGNPYEIISNDWILTFLELR